MHRMDINRRSTGLAVLSGALLLSACGGGGGGGGNNPSPPPAAAAGIVQFDASSLSIDENAGMARVTITRTGGSDGAVSATVASSDGSATAGQDYAALSTSLSFAAGDTAAKSVTVPIDDDSEGEAEETLRLTLSSPTGGARVGANATLTLTIRDNDRPNAPVLEVGTSLKKLLFRWASVAGATHYRLLQDPDGASGFTQVGGDHPAPATSATLEIAVHRLNWANARYQLEACGEHGCSASESINAVDAMVRAIGYFKASNTRADDLFGASVALSADGSTLAVGGFAEGSAATGVNGDQADDTAPEAGAVYLFTRDDEARWSQQAYVKASNTGESDLFGASLALSADGNTLAVGARREDSAATGVNSNQQGDNRARDAGAVYVFTRAGTVWSQQAYVKASNTGELDQFGESLALSADGSTLAVGGFAEDSAATGVNGDPADDTAPNAGAVYVFTRDDEARWSQQAYVKASNTEAGDNFGVSLALSADGSTLAVSASSEDSAATALNGDQADNGAATSGAVYLY